MASRGRRMSGAPRPAGGRRWTPSSLAYRGRYQPRHHGPGVPCFLMHPIVTLPALDPRALLAEGIALQKNGRHDEALAHYARAETATAEPALASEAVRRAASIHRTRTQWGDAIAAATRAAAIAQAAGCDEQHADAINAIALVHQARGAWD